MADERRHPSRVGGPGVGHQYLFDSTVRTEYKRTLDLAKSQNGTLAVDRPQLPITDITGSDCKQALAIKSRLAGCYCLRAPAQGTCSYANICEHCPSFHTTRLISESLLRNALMLNSSPRTPSRVAGSTRRAATSNS
ncbi:hypothetical protein [Gordonia aquimaris]|uniref:Uncharacterized protein n=1 Tax=Gordonia aquimaris TaxID=2984863 RepID=A0A9X3I353_9ACTN|nr:hypothetical protein [Gordonia aquimaris]MCX2963223.1 hypothetical protein [Gordonia aquimaris]